MYNCTNCNRIETLYFKCNDCNKLLCRSCISKNKHQCLVKTYEYKLDMFCFNEECINLKDVKCKKCKKEFCKTHLANHKCQKISCCILC